MKTTIALSLFCLLLVACGDNGSEPIIIADMNETYTVEAIDSGWVDSTQPDTPMVTEIDRLHCHWWMDKQQISYVKFSNPKKRRRCAVTRLILNVMIEYESGADWPMLIAIYQVKDTSWIGSELTWNNQPGFSEDDLLAVVEYWGGGEINRVWVLNEASCHFRGDFFCVAVAVTEENLCEVAVALNPFLEVTIWY